MEVRTLIHKWPCDRVAELIEAGADLIDIGGESTRPGAVSCRRKGRIEAA